MLGVEMSGEVATVFLRFQDGQSVGKYALAGSSPF